MDLRAFIGRHFTALIRSAIGLLAFILGLMASNSPDEISSNFQGNLAHASQFIFGSISDDVITVTQLLFLALIVFLCCRLAWPHRNFSLRFPWVPRPSKQATRPLPLHIDAWLNELNPFDVRPWSQQPVYKVFQAACLWVHAPIVDIVPFDHPAYQISERILGALKIGDIEALYPGINLQSQLKREDLIFLAVQWGLRPKFLFPD